MVPLGCTGHASVHRIPLARLDPPSNLHGSRHECWGGLGGMTHARESSLSSLASCSRPSSPPSDPHRFRPRVGQPIPDRPRSPPSLPISERPRVPPSAPERPRSPPSLPIPERPRAPRALPIPERPQVEQPARARPSLPIPERAVSRCQRLVSVHNQYTRCAGRAHAQLVHHRIPLPLFVLRPIPPWPSQNDH